VLIFSSSIGSLLIGAVGALYQNELKKFIAYASVNQIGFLFLGISNSSFFGFKSALTYLIIYTVMNFIFFGILINTMNLITGRNLIYFSDLNGISIYNKFIANILSLTLFSMAGIPPLAGFFTKFYVFCSIFQVSNYIYINYQTIYYSLVYVLILTLLSSFYYVNILKQLFFEKSINGQFF
jgi:NADH-quinone oxidoreductase subunit N